MTRRKTGVCRRSDFPVRNGAFAGKRPKESKKINTPRHFCRGVFFGKGVVFVCQRSFAEEMTVSGGCKNLRAKRRAPDGGAGKVPCAVVCFPGGRRLPVPSGAIRRMTMRRRKCSVFIGWQTQEVFSRFLRRAKDAGCFPHLYAGRRTVCFLPSVPSGRQFAGCRCVGLLLFVMRTAGGCPYLPGDNLWDAGAGLCLLYPFCIRRVFGVTPFRPRR